TSPRSGCTAPTTATSRPSSVSNASPRCRPITTTAPSCCRRRTRRWYCRLASSPVCHGRPALIRASSPRSATGSHANSCLLKRARRERCCLEAQSGGSSGGSPCLPWPWRASSAAEDRQWEQGADHVLARVDDLGDLEVDGQAREHVGVLGRQPTRC